MSLNALEPPWLLRSPVFILKDKTNILWERFFLFFSHFSSPKVNSRFPITPVSQYLLLCLQRCISPSDQRKSPFHPMGVFQERVRCCLLLIKVCSPAENDLLYSVYPLELYYRFPGQESPLRIYTALFLLVICALVSPTEPRLLQGRGCSCFSLVSSLCDFLSALLLPD